MGQTQPKPFFDGAQDPKSKNTMIQAQEDIEKYRYGDDTYTMGRISEALDMLGQVGKPVVITEFNGPSRNSTWNEKTTEYCWDLSEEENAAWQENFYRLAFSKPYIQQLTRWFLIDELGGKGMDAGILTTDGERRAIYDKLNQLINVEWHTHHKASLLGGETSLRGFYGTYQIEIKGYKKGVVEMGESGDYIVELEP
ncbi:MAG: hypothetical protein SNH94_03430 [Rikenellaceae bacterium]